MAEGKVVIAAERIGLPRDASDEAILERIYAMGEENVKLHAAVVNLTKKIEENASVAKERDRLLAEMAIEKAVAFQTIDASEREDWIEDYLENRERTERRLAKKHINGILRRAELGLSSSVVPDPDPFAELKVASGQKMAADKTLTEAEAVQQVYRENPDLFHRVTEARRTRVGKGGER